MIPTAETAEDRTMTRRESLDRRNMIRRMMRDYVKLATVSGIFTTKPGLIEWADSNIPELWMITTKSYQVKPNPGNREPIIAELGVGCFGNAVGLKNPGMEQGYQDLVELRKRHDLRCVLNVSLSASSIDDFVTLVKRFESIADILELNFSCPHAAAGYGASIGCDANIVYEYMTAIRNATEALLFPKLTPNVSDIGEIARAAVKAGADGIAAINTVGPELYIEPHTGKPILYNPNGHKGGKSGRWIKETAREKVREIRKAVGPYVPIIGMGGVETGQDVSEMIDAGADVVGIGSALALVPMRERQAYFEALVDDPDQGTDNASKFLINRRVAEYEPHRITKITEKGEGIRIFELEGSLDYDASQFAFIWAPEVGEKPFSIAQAEPLTFVVRKRAYDPENKKGLVTNALFQLKEGDEMMVRGVYGAEAPISDKEKAYIIAGGTGIAVVPRLAQELYESGKEVTVYYGMTTPDQTMLKQEIEAYAKLIPVADDGMVGRVVGAMHGDLSGNELEDSCFYNIGPVPLMQKLIKVENELLGVSTREIFASLETNNMCGIGICGECECGGRLTCQDGTFFSLEYLLENNIDIEKL